MIRQAAKNARVRAIGYIGHRPLAAADAVDPVAAMAVPDVWQPPVVLAEVRLHGALRFSRDTAPVHIQRPFAAVENHIIERILRALVNDLQPVGINHLQPAVAGLGRNDFHRARFINIHRPFCDVVMMRAHVA